MTISPGPGSYFSYRYYSRYNSRYSVHKQGGWEHYKKEGETGDLRPAPYFSAEWWIDRYGYGRGDFETSFENYLTNHRDTFPSEEYELIRRSCFVDNADFERAIRSNGRSRNGLIDFAYIAAQNNLSMIAPDPICLYLLLSGEGYEVSPSPLFDPRFYLDVGADVEESGMNPFVHFIRHGFFEGRMPSPFLEKRAEVPKDADFRALAGAYSPVELFNVKPPYRVHRGSMGEIGYGATVHINPNHLMGEPAIHGGADFDLMFEAYRAFMEGRQ